MQPFPLTPQNSTAPVGRNVLRKEGEAKVFGRSRYIDDITFPGMLHGATVRSSIARGRITNIQFGEGVDWEEFVIVTAKDIPGKNTIVHLMEDHVCLTDGFVNHPEEPILLIAHEDKAVCTTRLLPSGLSTNRCPPSSPSKKVRSRTPSSGAKTTPSSNT